MWLLNFLRFIPFFAIIKGLFELLFDDKNNKPPAFGKLREMLKQAKEKIETLTTENESLKKTIDSQEKEVAKLETLNKRLAGKFKSANNKLVEIQQELMLYKDGEIPIPTQAEILSILNYENPKNKHYIRRYIHSVRTMIIMMYMIKRGQVFCLDDGNVRSKVGHRNDSLHYEGLAQDINLYNDDGEYLTDTDDHHNIGFFWESSLGGSWGGAFEEPDGNHYSSPYDQRK